MNIQNNQPSIDKSKISIKQVSRGILSVIGILGLLICSSIGAQIAGGIFLGILMSSGGDTILHSDPNVGNTIIVHAVSDDCGVTCDCSTRLDIEYEDKIEKGVYRIHDVCDVEIRWLDEYKFEVIYKDRIQIILDAREFK
ncbi:MAG: hypothetical protein JNK81_16345 [Anaerolineales bacterium]|nr:hypothetical protein [Anaerolineales bacterium]